MNITSRRFWKFVALTVKFIGTHDLAALIPPAVYKQSVTDDRPCLFEQLMGPLLRVLQTAKTKPTINNPKEHTNAYIICQSIIVLTGLEFRQTHVNNSPILSLISKQSIDYT